MVNVRANFSTMFGDTSCNLCDSGQPQTQQHLLSCDAIIDKCVEARNASEVKYSDLFSNSQSQFRCAKVFAKILETKEELDDAILSSQQVLKF